MKQALHYIAKGGKPVIVLECPLNVIDFSCWSICLSLYQYVAGQKYRWWNCCQNPFAELTQVYGSQDASLELQNVIHAVRLFSWPPEPPLPSTNPQTQWSGWRISSCAVSAHSKWFHKFLSPDDLQCGLCHQYARWWFQSQQWIDRLQILHHCRLSSLLLHEAHLLQNLSFEQVFWWMCVSGTGCFCPKFLQ